MLSRPHTRYLKCPALEIKKIPCERNFSEVHIQKIYVILIFMLFFKLKPLYALNLNWKGNPLPFTRQHNLWMPPGPIKENSTVSSSNKNLKIYKAKNMSTHHQYYSKLQCRYEH